MDSYPNSKGATGLLGTLIPPWLVEEMMDLHHPRGQVVPHSGMMIEGLPPIKAETLEETETL